MTPQNTQAQIARWMGWTQDAARPEYWYTRDDPGHEGEPRRLPDLTTFAGVAEWCAVIEVEVARRELYSEIRRYPQRVGNVGVMIQNRVTSHDTVFRRATKLDALTAAVLELMENKS